MLTTTEDDSGFAGTLLASDDGGSGVGFFELDEELASPAFAEDRSFEMLLAQGRQGHEEEEEPTDGDPSRELGDVSNSNHHGQAADEPDEKEGHKWRHASPRRGRTLPDDETAGDEDGQGRRVNSTDDITVGSFTSGSVPINIVRPFSGSWVGSVGH